MSSVEGRFFELGRFDAISRQETPMHRLDPRAKLVTTLVFIGTVASFGKYEVSSLMPFFLYPLALCSLGNVPLLYLARKVAFVAPFAVLVGMFNPILDRETMTTLGSVEISGGLVSFASILVRFMLTVGAALSLVAVTGFNPLCRGLEQLGVPRIFVVQLMFVYRYLFVLVEESARMVRARSLRSFRKGGLNLMAWGSMVGHLLIRTLDRAQRIHLAMCSRGFQGEVRTLRTGHFGWGEAAFVLGWASAFVATRLWNVPQLIGDFMAGRFL